MAPGVIEVRDHAFYCDGALRYVDLPSCKYLAHDSFNGAAYDYAEDQLKNPEKVLAKIFLPNVVYVYEHAFWQTGFRVVEMPDVQTFVGDGVVFDENLVLQYVSCRFADGRCFVHNPQLREIKRKEFNKTCTEGTCGSPLLNGELRNDND